MRLLDSPVVRSVVPVPPTIRLDELLAAVGGRLGSHVGRHDARGVELQMDERVGAERLDQRDRQLERLAVAVLVAAVVQRLRADADDHVVAPSDARCDVRREPQHLPAEPQAV